MKTKLNALSAWLDRHALPFGAALAALLVWRNHRRNELAAKRPWRDVMEK